MEKSIKDMGWDELVIGAALKPFEGEIDYEPALTQPEDRKYAETSSSNAYVGDWRVMKPVWNPDVCINCQTCWVYCPDSAIITKDKAIVGIDYNHCKGCGICTEVCPTNPKALMLFNEHESNENALANWPEKKRRGK